MTSSSITVQWEAVDCINRNGDVIGYSVQYGLGGSENTSITNVSSGDIFETTLTDLISSTNYSIEVAAVNSAGVGVYSNAIFAKTDGKPYSVILKLC